MASSNCRCSKERYLRHSPLHWSPLPQQVCPSSLWSWNSIWSAYANRPVQANPLCWGGMSPSPHLSTPGSEKAPPGASNSRSRSASLHPAPSVQVLDRSRHHHWLWSKLRRYVLEFKCNGKCYVRNRHFLKPNLSIRHQLPAPEPSAQTPPTPVVPDTSADLPAQPPVLRRSLCMSVKPIRFKDKANAASQNRHLMWAAAPQVFYFSKD